MAAEDGVTFKPDTVQAVEIRKEANYADVRVTLLGLIDGARCPIQLDTGFGDAVTPGPEEVHYPVMLPDFDAPKLRVYPRYTVVAEKLEAMATLGIANSRTKDFFDLWVLSRHTNFDRDTLQRAIRATFDRRRTELPSRVPFGLTDDFARDTQKQTQWQAFLRKTDSRRFNSRCWWQRFGTSCYLPSPQRTLATGSRNSGRLVVRGPQRRPETLYRIGSK